MRRIPTSASKSLPFPLAPLREDGAVTVEQLVGPDQLVTVLRAGEAEPGLDWC
jgi:hypothetical protein